MTTGHILKALFQVAFKGTEKKDKQQMFIFFLIMYLLDICCILNTTAFLCKLQSKLNVTDDLKKKKKAEN